LGATSHLARSFQPGGEQAHLESRRHHRFSVPVRDATRTKLALDAERLADGRSAARMLTTQAGPICPPVGEGRFSLEKPRAVLRQRRPGEAPCRTP